MVRDTHEAAVMKGAAWRLMGIITYERGIGYRSMITCGGGGFRAKVLAPPRVIICDAPGASAKLDKW